MDVTTGVDTAVNGAIIIGVVNAASIFVPNLDSRAKLALALLAAAVLVYIPAGPIVNILSLLFASSGGYKVFQIVGAARK